jgi:hypothetical protein
MDAPPGRDKMGRNELGANVTLAEGFLVHAITFKRIPPVCVPLCTPHFKFQLLHSAS